MSKNNFILLDWKNFPPLTTTKTQNIEYGILRKKIVLSKMKLLFPLWIGGKCRELRGCVVNFGGMCRELRGCVVNRGYVVAETGHRTIGQSNNDNRSWNKRCNNIVSYEFLWIRRTCAYIQFNIHYYTLSSGRVSFTIMVRIRLSVSLVSGYAHEFVLVSTVIVTLPLHRQKRRQHQFLYCQRQV